MKRFHKILLSMLLLISLSSMTLAAFAQNDPLALQITQMEVVQASGNLTLNMTLENTGSAAIDEFGLALAFFDKDGNQFYAYDHTLDGYMDEVCNWYYTPENAINAGDTYITEDVFSDYADAVMVAAAIRYYHVVDGDYISIPESDWQWQTPDNIDHSASYVPSYYISPLSSVYDEIGDYSPGYNYYLLDDFNANYYGKSEGGEWINSIEDGSPAALAGLVVGDLIISVDGMKPTENVYAVEYGMASIAGGTPVDWVYERNGVSYTTQLTN